MNQASVVAVGAQTREIFRMILGEGLKLSLTGVALGMVGALTLGQAGVAACCVPARRP